MKDKNLKDKILTVLVSVLFFPLIVMIFPLIVIGLIVAGLFYLFDAPKRKKEYINSLYYKNIGNRYIPGIVSSPEYRFYNNALKRKLPIEYIKQKSNGFEYFVYDGTAYIFPDFEQIKLDKEKNEFLVDYDGDWESFDKAYESLLSNLENKAIPAKVIVERTMFSDFKLSESDIPENVFLTWNYETAFENEDSPLKLTIPKNTFELYEMMKQTPTLCGEFEYSESKEIIVWNPHEKIEIHIAVGKRDCYFELFSVSSKNTKYSITHWHPDLYEAYEEVCLLGERGNVLVVRSSFFADGVLYQGKKEDCPYPPDKKYLFGRYYYIEME